MCRYDDFEDICSLPTRIYCAMRQKADLGLPLGGRPCYTLSGPIDMTSTLE